MSRTASHKRPFHVIAGAGTVGYFASRALLKNSQPAPRRMAVIDSGVIKPQNAVSCEDYAGHHGQPKVARAATLLRAAGASFPIIAMHRSVQDVDWREDIFTDTHGEPTFVIAGLDDWSARMHLVSRVREIAYKNATLHITVLQGSLDKSTCQLSVFSSNYQAFCPACGLSLLPMQTPCIAEDDKGKLLRGDLRQEAAVLADLVCEVTNAMLKDNQGRQWLDTKTTVTIGPDGRISRETRKRERVPGCVGPHSPAASPLRWRTAP